MSSITAPASFQARRMSKAVAGGFIDMSKAHRPQDSKRRPSISVLPGPRFELREALSAGLHLYATGKADQTVSNLAGQGHAALKRPHGPMWFSAPDRSTLQATRNRPAVSERDRRRR